MARFNMQVINGIVEFIRQDFQENFWRACVEIVGMAASVIASVILAATTPHPPMLVCYGFWLVASGSFYIAAMSRGSFGLAASFLAFLLIDTVGLIKTLLA